MIEEFIRKNREAFDDAIPPQSVWQSIESNLPSPGGRLIELRLVYKVAAAVNVILGVGVLLGFYLGSQNQSSQTQVQLAHMEQYYQEKLNARMQLLTDYQASDMVRGELASLETGYAKLTSETPLDQDRYMLAVMRNFEARLALVEKVISHLEKYSNQGKKEKDEIRDLQI